MASSKAAIWMTFAAAAGTLAVAIGVIAGPTLVRCYSDPAGLLSCMRGEVVEVGLLPEQVAPEPAPTAEPQAPEPVPAAEPAPASPAAEPPDVNLVRAEPDGQVIIAGTGAPGIEIEVFANGDLVGKVKAEASGDWVLIPDRPLAVGTAEISVGAAGTNERSPHTFTVTIPADKTSAPTITASQPSPPVSEPAPAAAPEPQTVKAEPVVPDAQVALAPPQTSQPEPAAPPAMTAEPTPASQPEPQVATAPEPKPETELAPAPEPEPTPSATPAPQPVETNPLVADPPVAEPQPATATPTVEPEPAVESPSTPDPQMASVPEIEVEPNPKPEPTTQPSPLSPKPVPVSPAETEPPLQLAETAPTEQKVPAPPVTPVPTAPATIDAIEIDGSANYFAGAGPEGATVNLYVQDKFIASARVEGGRWLVEAQGALNLPVQRVRIDLIKPQQGDVSARAEVNFVIDVPPPAPEIEVNASASGSATPAASVATDVAIAPQLESELEVDPAIPTLRSLPAVDPEMLRFASGKAIIRRGETLWAIAERVYGDGRLYPRIVEANGELITRPGRIYPGQVFDLPKLEQSAPVN